MNARSTVCRVKCGIDGCDNQHHALGLCITHYSRRRRHGEPKRSEPIRTTGRGRPILERLMTKVEHVGDCWMFRGSPNGVGYGKIWYQGRKVYAHRLIYELLVGVIPQGLTLDHVKARGCLGPPCINPDHLEPVTQAENLRRGRGAAWVNRNKTHCPKHHPYDDANTYVNPRGGRECRTCMRDRNRSRSRSTEPAHRIR